MMDILSISDVAKDYIKKTFPQDPLSWPGYSPDISPIENIWGWLKGEVSRDQPSDVASLKSSLRRHWKRVTPEFLAPYIDSMPNRMEEVLKNNGKKINY